MPTLDDDLEPAEDRRTSRYKSERDNYRRALEQSEKALQALQAKCDLLTSIDGVKSEPPNWLTPKRRVKSHGIANLMLSDLHLYEVVKPSHMNWVNSYNREIALYRLQRTFEKAIEHTKDYLTGVTVDGFGLWLGGDIFSGNIHEELKNTNEVPIMASIDFWVDPFVAGMKMLADHYGKVHVANVVGNHGRNTHKPVMKNRVEDNFDWLFARILQRELSSDSRFTWSIPLTADVICQQYDTRILMTHGDQFRGGSGISGIYTPISLGMFRKGQNYAQVDDPFDHAIMGHFHQYLVGRNWTINGSMKGYDGYAAISNFGFEVPQQAMWITTPERGVTWQFAIQPSSKKHEGW